MAVPSDQPRSRNAVLICDEHSNVTAPACGHHNAQVRESCRTSDLVREFVNAARAAGIKPGLYYIVNSNYYLSVSSGVVVPKKSATVTNVEYYALVLGQVR